MNPPPDPNIEVLPAELALAVLIIFAVCLAAVIFIRRSPSLLILPVLLIPGCVTLTQYRERLPDVAITFSIPW